MTAPSYSTNDPKGWCGDMKRGAAMGRGSVKEADPSEPVKLYVRRVYLNNGGYDRNGTYFGTGLPLYWIANAEGTVDYMTRASARWEAKRIACVSYPKARFFR